MARRIERGFDCLCYNYNYCTTAYCAGYGTRVTMRQGRRSERLPYPGLVLVLVPARALTLIITVCRTLRNSQAGFLEKRIAEDIQYGERDSIPGTPGMRHDNY
jgi:hypothetical protein